MSAMRLNDTCVCGATLEVASSMPSDSHSAHKRWLEHHQQCPQHNAQNASTNLSSTTVVIPKNRIFGFELSIINDDTIRATPGAIIDDVGLCAYTPHAHEATYKRQGVGGIGFTNVEICEGLEADIYFIFPINDSYTPNICLLKKFNNVLDLTPSHIQNDYNRYWLGRVVFKEPYHHLYQMQLISTHQNVYLPHD